VGTSLIPQDVQDELERGYTDYIRERRTTGRRVKRTKGFGLGFANPLVPFFFPISQIEEEGTPSPTERAVDLTDPTVAASWDDLTPAERKMRFIKRFGARTRGAAEYATVLAQAGDSPIGLAFPTSASQTAQTEQEHLAEPASFEEKFADWAALTLVQMGIFAPLGVGIAGEKAAGAVAGVGMGAAARALPNLQRALGARMMGQQAARLEARTGVKTAGRGVPFLGRIRSGRWSWTITPTRRW